LSSKYLMFTLRRVHATALTLDHHITTAAVNDPGPHRDGGARRHLPRAAARQGVRRYLPAPLRSGPLAITGPGGLALLGALGAALAVGGVALVLRARSTRSQEGQP
jgi:hypothetical protein